MREATDTRPASPRYDEVTAATGAKAPPTGRLPVGETMTRASAAGGALPMKVMPLRLPPGADLRRALEAWMGEQQEPSLISIWVTSRSIFVLIRFI
jgi:hypothetical protein